MDMFEDSQMLVYGEKSFLPEDFGIEVGNPSFYLKVCAERRLVARHIDVRERRIVLGPIRPLGDALTFQMNPTASYRGDLP